MSVPLSSVRSRERGKSKLAVYEEGVIGHEKRTILKCNFATSPALNI